MGESGSTKRICDGKEFPIEEEGVLRESGSSSRFLINDGASWEQQFYDYFMGSSEGFR